MDEKLYQALLRLPKANLINLMWEALAEMQSYNGRGRTECIAIALGLEDKEDPESNTTHYRIPSLATMKKATKAHPF